MENSEKERSNLWVFVQRWRFTILIALLVIAFVLSCNASYNIGQERLCSNSHGQVMKDNRDGKTFCLINMHNQCEDYLTDKGDVYNVLG